MRPVPAAEWLTDLLLIQCKNYKGKLKQYEIDNLKALEKQTGGTAIHVFKDKNRRLNCVPIH